MTAKKERKFNLREFRAIVLAISTYDDTSLLVQHIVEGLCKTFSIKGASILLYDESEKQLFRISSFGLSDEYLNKGAITLNGYREEFLKGKTILYDNVSTDTRIQYGEAAVKEGIASILSVPINYRGKIIGLLKAYHGEPMNIHEEDLESLEVLLQQLGVVIELKGMKNFISRIKAVMETMPSRAFEE